MVGYFVGAFGGSLAVCLALTPLVRAFARRTGFVDRSDGYRKMHGGAALGGGIAVLAAFVIASTGLLAVVLIRQGVATEKLRFFIGLLIASMVVAAVGLIDDWIGMRGRHKLVGQIAACMILMGFGVRIHGVSVLGLQWDLGLLMIPVTLVWLLGAINAINLIDGVDGLASSVGFLLCLTVAILTAFAGNMEYSLIAIVMAGALLAFLCYNFPPASIYLGDAGSMLIGLVVGALAVSSCVKGSAVIAFFVPACVLSIPILDSTAALVRRKLTRRSLFAADRGHFHHLLLQRGWSPRKTVLFISAVCLVTCAGALLSVVVRKDYVAISTMALVFTALIGAKVFGHVEFGLILHRVLFAFRSRLVRYSRESNGTSKSAYRLCGTRKWLDVWSGLTESAEPYNLLRIELSISIPSIYESFYAICTRRNGGTPDQEWKIESPLFVDGHPAGSLVVVGHSDHSPVLSMGEVLDFLEPIESQIAELANGSPAGKVKPGQRRTGDAPHASNGDGEDSARPQVARSGWLVRQNTESAAAPPG